MLPGFPISLLLFFLSRGAWPRLVLLLSPLVQGSICAVFEAVVPPRSEEERLMTHHPLKPLLLDLLRQAQSSQNGFFQQVPEAERVQRGSPDCWSAKDHVAHLTFWRQRLALRLQAILHNDPQPEALNFEPLNPLLFEEHRSRP